MGRWQTRTMRTMLRRHHARRTAVAKLQADVQCILYTSISKPRRVWVYSLTNAARVRREARAIHTRGDDTQLNAGRHVQHEHLLPSSPGYVPEMASCMPTWGLDTCSAHICRCGTATRPGHAPAPVEKHWLHRERRVPEEEAPETLRALAEPHSASRLTREERTMRSTATRGKQPTA